MGGLRDSCVKAGYCLGCLVSGCLVSGCLVSGRFVAVVAGALRVAIRSGSLGANDAGDGNRSRS